ncbi:MAG: AAA family ATPase [Proteobacteria bacterium]|nr:AAA family ATPase [Pseudomonadota bacterium]MDA1021824.1 AAA family ATPase [Pseudomonadota bacterium]
MSTNSQQDEVVRFLSTPQAFGSATGPVDRVETHVSFVFLCGMRALKLKRSVTFPYLDFSSIEKRRLACEAEVTINSRTAPTIYKGVVAVTRGTDGALALGGDGDPVDWLVDMNRFDEDTLFDRLAQNDGLDRAMMEDLADAIAEFHLTASPVIDAGGRDGLGAIIENNAMCFGGSEDFLNPSDVENLTGHSLQALDSIGDILDRRRLAGRVRHCHGDLHLRNICLIDGKPTLFDGIEFNQEFANIDVLYDLAFLIMDLDYRGHRRLANIVLNRYLDSTGDGEERAGGLPILPLLLSMRAAIRSHVDAAQVSSLSDPEKAKARAGESAGYLAMALAYLKPGAPRLIAVGGLSGSGKSRLARELAPHLGASPGARVVRTDSIRKRISGQPLTARLGPDGYSAAMTKRTYAAFMEECETALKSGRVTIADAVFAQPEERACVAALAEKLSLPFTGLWLQASPEIMADRVTRRKRNVSDATADVVEKQLGYDLGKIDWTRLDSSGTRDETLKAGIAATAIPA